MYNLHSKKSIAKLAPLVNELARREWLLWWAYCIAEHCTRTFTAEHTEFTETIDTIAWNLVSITIRHSLSLGSGEAPGDADIARLQEADPMQMTPRLED